MIMITYNWSFGHGQCRLAGHLGSKLKPAVEGLRRVRFCEGGLSPDWGHGSCRIASAPEPPGGLGALPRRLGRNFRLPLRDRPGAHKALPCAVAGAGHSKFP